MQGASLTLQIAGILSQDALFSSTLPSVFLYNTAATQLTVSFSYVHVEHKLLILRNYPWRFCEVSYTWQEKKISL